jgi:hypothetical protein
VKGLKTEIWNRVVAKAVLGFDRNVSRPSGVSDAMMRSLVVGVNKDVNFMMCIATVDEMTTRQKLSRTRQFTNEESNEG